MAARDWSKLEEQARQALKRNKADIEASNRGVTSRKPPTRRLRRRRGDGIYS